MKWLGLHDKIPEIGSSDLALLCLSAYGITCKSVDNRPHLLRFSKDRVSLDLPTHNRGATFSPLAVLRLLEKFNLKPEQFRAAYNEHFKLSPPHEASARGSELPA